MSAVGLEALLAGLLADPAATKRFLDDPESDLAAADLTQSERAALGAIDRAGLAMAAASIAAKRAHYRRRPTGWRRWWRRLTGW